MNDNFRIKEYYSMKKGALISWPILPLTLGVLCLFYGEPREQSIFVFSIIVFVSTAVCLPMFTYGAYKEDKLIQKQKNLKQKEKDKKNNLEILLEENREKTKNCIKCGTELILRKNWYESAKKYSIYICNECQKKDRKQRDETKNQITKDELDMHMEEFLRYKKEDEEDEKRKN